MARFDEIGEPDLSLFGGGKISGGGRHYEEPIYGIADALTFTVGGTAIEVRPGDALCIPRGAVHGFENKGSTDAKTLVVITQAALGPEYFRETFAVLAAAAGGPPNKPKIAEIMRRYRLTPVLPPR